MRIHFRKLLFFYLLSLIAIPQHANAQLYGDAYHSPSSFAQTVNQIQSGKPLNVNTYSTDRSGWGSVFGGSNSSSGPVTWRNQTKAAAPGYSAGDTGAAHKAFIAKILAEEKERKRKENLVKAEKEAKFNLLLSDLSDAMKIAGDTSKSFNLRMKAAGKAIEIVNGEYNRIRGWYESKDPLVAKALGNVYSVGLTRGDIYFRNGDYREAGIDYQYYKNIPALSSQLFATYGELNLFCQLLQSGDTKKDVKDALDLYSVHQGKYMPLVYSLFLYNEFTLASGLLEKELENNPQLTAKVKGMITSRIILLKLLGNRKEEALALFNKNSKEQIQDAEFLAGYVSSVIGDDLRERIESFSYGRISTLFDIDLLCAVYPQNPEMKNIRKTIAEKINFQRGTYSLQTVWSEQYYKEAEKQQTIRGLQLYLNNDIKNTDPLITESMQYLGIALKNPSPEQYAQYAADFVKKVNKYSTDGVISNFSVDHGYMKFSHKTGEVWLARIEDIDTAYAHYFSGSWRIYFATNRTGKQEFTLNGKPDFSGLKYILKPKAGYKEAAMVADAAMKLLQNLKN